jgi:hypothetical protein
VLDTNLCVFCTCEEKQYSLYYLFKVRYVRIHAYVENVAQCHTSGSVTASALYARELREAIYGIQNRSKNL